MFKLELLQVTLAEADRLGVDVISRYQRVREMSIAINNGKTERIVNEEHQGLGVQAFTREGFSGFSASDNPDHTAAKELVNRAVQLAVLSREFGGETNKAVFSAPIFSEGMQGPCLYSFDHLELSETEKLVKLENDFLLELFPGVSIQTVYRQVEEYWHIVRSGGTDTWFTVPRAVLAHTFTNRKDGQSATTRSAFGGADISILIDEKKREEGRRRSELIGRLSQDLLKAEKVKSGHHKLVIDYALAKGLAHEAFGHAVETDGMTTSILGHGGKLRTGIEVASPKVSITDSPLEMDWAYQPISANGIPRQSVKIVERGKLSAGLGDLFSGPQAGVAVTGAGRAESYGQIPLPRMTNIRIEVEEPIPLTKPWYKVTPRELYFLLLDNNLIAAEEEVYYLMGYKGGQVNTQSGDFVFNCSAIYKLGPEPVLYKPGIFAGKTLSALKSIRAGIGPVIADALGTCGKWGQSVPSSGGSNAFLLLDSHPEITIGGGQ